MLDADALLAELQARVSRNPKYSLRAFARDLKMDPGSLCKILRGKRVLGTRLGRRIRTAINQQKCWHLIGVGRNF